MSGKRSTGRIYPDAWTEMDAREARGKHTNDTMGRHSSDSRPATAYAPVPDIVNEREGLISDRMAELFFEPKPAREHAARLLGDGTTTGFPGLPLGMAL